MTYLARLSFRPLLLLATLTLLLSGCNTTEVTNNWSAPGVTSLQFKKIFIVAMAQDDTNRRLIENTLRNNVQKIEVQVSHKLVPGVLSAKDKDSLLQAAKESGCDGIVLLKLKNGYVDTQVTRVSTNTMPMDYAIYSDFYSSTYDVGAMYTGVANSVTADSIIRLVCNVYDLNTQKLVWSCETVSKKGYVAVQDVGAVATEIAKTLKGAMQEKGLAH